MAVPVSMPDVRVEDGWMEWMGMWETQSKGEGKQVYEILRAEDSVEAPAGPALKFNQGPAVGYISLLWAGIWVVERRQVLILCLRDSR